MSRSERHRRSKNFRSLCAACQERKAKFKYRRQVRADRDHTLCFECYRAEINRTRARRLQARMPVYMKSPFGSPEASGDLGLNERQLTHRLTMLDHLQRAPETARRHAWSN